MAFVLKILGAIVGVLIVAVAIFLVTFNINDWKGWLEEQATAALGRKVTIEGPLDIVWGWTPRVTVEGLAIANTDWAEDPNFAEFEKLDFTIKLWELIKGKTVLPEINLAGPGLFLQQNENEETNWSFNEDTGQDGPAEDTAEETAEEMVVPDDRSEFPLIGRLTIKDGRFEFLDEVKKIDLAGDINTVTGEGGGSDEVEIGGKGQLENETFSIELLAGALTKLRNTEDPYPVDLKIGLGDTKAAITGTLTRPLELAGVDLNLSISGQNMADTFPITGVPLPLTPPYRLSGDLARDGDAWRFANFDGALGDSDLKGTIAVDLGQDPLHFNADLISDKLDFADLAGFAGAPTEEEPDRDSDKIIPDTEINLARLQAASGKASLRAKKILAPNLPIDDLDTTLTLEDGVLRLEPASFGIAKGTVNLWISLYGAQEPVQIDMLARIRDLQLKEAFRGSEYVQETGGSVDGRIELSGRGKSVHEMLDTAEGTSYVVMSGGNISALIIEAVSLDAGEGLGLYFGEDTNVPINCLATDFEVADGVAITKLAVLDTTDSVIEFGGNVDLGKEQLDLEITPHPKDVSLLNLRSKVHVEGTFVEPAISLDAGSILKFVPLIDLGLAEDAPCDRLIARAREDDS